MSLDDKLDEPAPVTEPTSPVGAVGGASLALRYAGGAAGAGAGRYVVPAKNRWSRVVLAFTDLRAEAWAALHLRLAWEADETALQVLDFAAVGFDFRAADGSSLDYDHVPGLARSLLDPHTAWIAGPAYQPVGAEAGSAALRIAFRAPALARNVSVTLRSWRNARPFTVSEVALHQDEVDPAPLEPAVGAERRLGLMPLALSHALVPGAGLVLRGQLAAARAEEHAARVSVTYADAAGASIPPPYPGTVSVPGIGALINLSAQPQARRFTLDLEPPAGAAVVELGFQTWQEGANAAMVALLAAPEVALPDALRLEGLCGEDLLDADAFIARLCGRLGIDADDADRAAAWSKELGAPGPPLPVTRVSAMRSSRERLARSGEDDRLVLSLAGEKDWVMPEVPDWSEDPFRSLAWRLEYQSLAWLFPVAGLPRTAVCAQAWSQANPWGSPSDPISLHPAALAARADVLVGLLDVGATALVGEVVRHGFALAEIVGQNTFVHSLHQVQAAAALLGLARALPRLPLGPHWEGLARASLHEAVGGLLGLDGRFAEPSLHRRLELLSYLKVLAEVLGPTAPGPALAARAATALPGIAALLDPGGRLPAFGDSPQGIDHAAWLARLGVPAPRGEGAAQPTAPDMVARSHVEADGRWGHFACTAGGRSPGEHADTTSFVFATGGQRWIVDSGGSEGVESGAARHYLLSAQAHNVAIPDGRPPIAGPGWIAARRALEGAELLVLGTGVHGAEYHHRRLFVVLDDLAGLAVIDRFACGDRPVAFEGYIHFAPGALVALSGPQRAMAQMDGRRLALVPWEAAGRAAGLSVASGCDARAGAMQGFVSTGPGRLQAASVLRYAFTGRGTVAGGLLVAANGAAGARLARLLGGEAVAPFLA